VVPAARHRSAETEPEGAKNERCPFLFPQFLLSIDPIESACFGGLPCKTIGLPLARSLLVKSSGRSLLNMADVPPKNPTRITGAFRFTAAVGDTGESSASRKGATFAASMVFHSIIAVTIVIVPILASDMMPTPSDSVLKAFFVQPGEMAPPPPPPPPPAPGPRPTIKTQAPPTPADAAFVAPIETPAEIKPEQNLDFSFGVEGGVAGGVEGGVPGGVVGGIVGGMPNEGPPPPRQLVRVGGNVKTPK